MPEKKYAELLTDADVKAGSVSGKVKLSPTLTWLGMVNDAVLEFENGRLVRWSSRSSKERLDSLINDQPENERRVSALTIGLNRLVRYGYAQDRFVAGSIRISGQEYRDCKERYSSGRSNGPGR